ncbi:hypothetical protein OKW22_001088 [Bacilli bacterium PM5-3]|nr:hypothetical protein [Bacilli bacterium PM5-3]MDH6603273.1 hypothetical protein [Bacilli bacterium PM5-9]
MVIMSEEKIEQNDDLDTEVNYSYGKPKLFNSKKGEKKTAFVSGFISFIFLILFLFIAYLIQLI